MWHHSNSYATPVAGATIYKEGSTTKQTSGKILSNSSVVYYTLEDGTTVSVGEVIMTTVLNLGGDSGGLAYTSSGAIIGSMSGSTYSGSELTEDSFVYSYICKYENAAERLNCSVVE